MTKRQNGFTLIELMVTLALGTALIVSFFAIYRAGLGANTAAARQTTARNVAYTGLRKYSQSQPVSWPFPCDATTNGVQTGGFAIETTDVTAQGLPAPATLTVRVMAPYGCDGVNADMPVLVEATVLYGRNNLKAVYATYVKK